MEITIRTGIIDGTFSNSNSNSSRMLTDHSPSNMDNIPTHSLHCLMKSFRHCGKLQLQSFVFRSKMDNMTGECFEFLVASSSSNTLSFADVTIIPLFQ